MHFVFNNVTVLSTLQIFWIQLELNFPSSHVCAWWSCQDSGCSEFEYIHLDHAIILNQWSEKSCFCCNNSSWRYIMSTWTWISICSPRKLRRLQKSCDTFTISGPQICFLLCISRPIITYWSVYLLPFNRDYKRGGMKTKCKNIWQSNLWDSDHEIMVLVSLCKSYTGLHTTSIPRII